VHTVMTRVFQIDFINHGMPLNHFAKHATTPTILSRIIFSPCD
jgi:hypothetical protein